MDGTNEVTLAEAKAAAQTLLRWLSQLADRMEVPASTPTSSSEERYFRPIDELRRFLHPHLFWRLREMGIGTIGELVQRPEREILKPGRIGLRMLAELKDALASHGLVLGTEIEGWADMVRRREEEAAAKASAAEARRAQAIETLKGLGIPDHERLLQHVDEIEFSRRAAKCLEKADIRFIGELVSRSRLEIRVLAGVGPKMQEEIEGILASMGLRLGMEFPGVDFRTLR